MSKKKYASKNGNCFTALMDMFIGSVSLVLVIATIALTIAGILAVSTGALIIIALLIGIGVIYILFKIIKFIIVITKSIISSSKTYNSQENVEEFVDFTNESPLIPQGSYTSPDNFDVPSKEVDMSQNQTSIVISNTYSSIENDKQFIDSTKKTPSIPQSIDTCSDDFDIPIEEAGKYVTNKNQLSTEMPNTYNSRKNSEQFINSTKELLSITQNLDSYPDDFDMYFEEAGRYVIEHKEISIGMLQRMLKIGFNRASRIMEQLSATGVITLDLMLETGKAIMSLKEFEAFIISSDYLNRVSAPDENYEPSSKELDRLNLYNNKFDYMSGNDFEYYCAELLKKSGFMKVHVTSASGDYGADILAEQHGIKYAIQCKCYSSDIGIDAVYQISGGMKYYEANVGCVLTNRYFTRQARELADKIGIILWDRDFLNKLVQNSTQN